METIYFQIPMCTLCISSIAINIHKVSILSVAIASEKSFHSARGTVGKTAHVELSKALGVKPVVSFSSPFFADPP